MNGTLALVFGFGMVVGCDRPGEAARAAATETWTVYVEVDGEPFGREIVLEASLGATEPREDLASLEAALADSADPGAPEPMTLGVHVVAGEELVMSGEVEGGGEMLEAAGAVLGDWIDQNFWQDGAQAAAGVVRIAVQGDLCCSSCYQCCVKDCGDGPGSLCGSWCCIWICA